ncbi:hypothetical protein [Lewinella sp. JB7]|uniref:hypothetical protein n=1 Tax=Lewinella sp. JB7 TaxID=2962887 RepID=UPI0020CA1A36|nr:hypothetical protein [Lewinella sp. JB7]MCP9236180.1 hypothetical protein [Lewinella sp. JB7]
MRREVTLGRIFVFPETDGTYTLRELVSFPVRASFCTELSDQLGLIYAGVSGGGSVCFARSPELQPAYKTVFTQADLLRYLTVRLTTLRHYGRDTPVPLPETADDFWRSLGN